MKNYLLILCLICFQLSTSQTKQETINWLTENFKTLQFYNGDSFEEIIEITPCLISFKLKNKKGNPVEVSFLVKANWKTNISLDSDNKWVELESSNKFSLKFRNYAIVSRVLSFKESENSKLLELVKKLTHLASFCDK